jgi:hypothetical protein
LIEYIADHHAVWWATHAEIAEYVRSQPDSASTPD